LWRGRGRGLVLIVALVTARVGGAAGPLRIHQPGAQSDRPTAEEERFLAVPLYWTDEDAAPGEPDYLTYEAGAAPRHPGGRAVARLARIPGGTTAVAVKFYSPRSAADEEEVGIASLALFRYTVDGRPVYVATNEPTAAAAQRRLMLGSDRVDRPSGRTVYTATEWHRERGNLANKVAVNGVSFSENGLIISVSGDLPLTRLIELAGDVTLGE
jgi:hypothetical protein